ncbi:MAG: PASTA domain-containing protein [Bacteroidales bacterium]|nr:PASTA domain-containing protein [Bacteroidales bacterium]
MAVAVTAVLLILVFTWLKIYTHHGQAYSVPNFQGLTMAEAQDLAKGLKLRLEVSDSVYLKDYKRGTVIDQNPAPDFKVKKRRRVFLTMNALNPEKIAMPNLIGLSLRQAQAILDNKGLIIGDLSYVPDIADNNVLKQQYEGSNIRPGDTLLKGSKIDLVLGKGLSNRSTYTPDLIGMRLEEARKHIAAASLNLGSVLYDESIITFTDSINAYIYKQAPNPGSQARIRLGSSVDIFLTIDDETMESDDNEN